MAQLVAEAETAQLVVDVNTELEKLSEPPAVRRQEAAAMRDAETTLLHWMES